jgi:hypothetical protein
MRTLILLFALLIGASSLMGQEKSKDIPAEWKIFALGGINAFTHGGETPSGFTGSTMLMIDSDIKIIGIINYMQTNSPGLPANYWEGFAGMAGDISEYAYIGGGVSYFGAPTGRTGSWGASVMVGGQVPIGNSNFYGIVQGRVGANDNFFFGSGQVGVGYRFKKSQRMRKSDKATKPNDFF